MSTKKKLVTIMLMVLFGLNFTFVFNMGASTHFVDNQYPFSPATISKQLSIKTFSGPDVALSVIHDSIMSATESFYLEIYTLSKESLINDLISINSSGVEVIVLLSHDRVNYYEDEYTAEAAKRLYDAGIEVLWTSSTFRFTHAKFWIVDHNQVGIYSGNWAPSSVPDNPAKGNREFGVIIYDSEVAQVYENLFFDDLAIATPYTPETTSGNLAGEPSSGSYDYPFTYATFNEYMEVTPVFSPDNSYQEISALLARATSTIDLELQYILHDTTLLQDLVNAALRGVRVRVIINKPDDEPGTGNNVTDVLLSNGISVTYFDSNLAWNHNKYVCVDNEEVLIASINWSNNSLTNNREAGIIIKNANVAAFYQSIFEYDWNNGEFIGGNIPVVKFVQPQESWVISGSYDIQVSFSGTNYSTAELKIDDTLLETWTNPIGLESFTLDTTSISNGVHDLKVTAYPTEGGTITIWVKINVINDITKWLLLITEVRYNAESEPYGEFFEIYNGFDFPLTISGWLFTDNEDIFKLPFNTIIGPDDVLVFARDESTFISEMNNLGITGVTPNFVYSGIALSNTGDELIFKDANGIIRDAVAWGSGSVSGVISWSGTLNEDESLQRVPANEDTNDCNVDFTKDSPTPGRVTIGTTTSGTTETTNTSEPPKETTTETFPLNSSLIITIITIFGLTSVLIVLRKRRI